MQKTFLGPGYLHSGDGVVWLWHILANLYIWLTISSCCGSIRLALGLIVRDGVLNTLCHSCGFAYQQRELKTFCDPGYFQYEDGVFWLWHPLANLYIRLTISPCYDSIPLALGLIGRDDVLNTLCHSDGFACQERMLRTFSGPIYFHSKDGVVWLWHPLVNLYLWLTISSLYGSITLGFGLIGRDTGLSTLGHSCGLAFQQSVLKAFPASGYLHSEDGVVWSWHPLVNLYIWLTISSCYGSIRLALGLIVSDDGLSTLCHTCGFACQQRVLKTFRGPGCFQSENGVVWLWHWLANFYIRLTIPSCYDSSPLVLRLIRRVDVLNTLCHSDGFACQQRMLKTFPCPVYFHCKDGVVWLWHPLLNLYVCLTISSSYGSILLARALTVRDGVLSTLCHSCGFSCQQRVLKTFPGPDYLHAEDGVVWLWHEQVNLHIWLTISSSYGSIPLGWGLIVRDGDLGTLCHSCGFVSQQRLLKMFSGPGYFQSEDGDVWLWYPLLNFYVWLTISSCYGSIPLGLGSIGRDIGLSTLCHSCGLAFQQSVLKVFPASGYLHSEDRVVWLWHPLGNL